MLFEENVYQSRNVILGCFKPTCCLLPAQLFSSEEKRASQQHRVTVHGAPGPEPFTVFSVTEQTTAKQLLDMVSTGGIKLHCAAAAQGNKSPTWYFFKRRIYTCHTIMHVWLCSSTGCGVSRKPVRLLFVWGEGPLVEGARRRKALRSPSTTSARGRGGQARVQLGHRGGIRGEDLPQIKRWGTKGRNKPTT